MLLTGPDSVKIFIMFLLLQFIMFLLLQRLVLSPDSQVYDHVCFAGLFEKWEGVSDEGRSYCVSHQRFKSPTLLNSDYDLSNL